jgi:flagellar assembly factor FliW
MKVITKHYGEIEVDDKQKVFFPEGLFGFESQQDFVVFPAEQSPFYFLQSCMTVEVCLPLIDPFDFRPDYEFEADDEVLKKIHIDSPSKTLVFVIVTVPPDGNSPTANLKGPIVMNKDTHEALQVILSNDKWHTKHDIISELKQYKAAS